MAARRKVITSRKQFDRVHTAKPKHMPPAEDKKTLTGATKIVGKLRKARENMITLESTELRQMNEYRQAYQQRLVDALATGKITPQQFKARMNEVNKKIAEKTERIDAINHKANFLIEPRLRALERLALGETFFHYLLSHEAYAEMVKKKLNSSRENPVQTIALVDIDRLKKSNAMFSHIRGGTVILTAYAEAARDIAKKYGGIVSRYGSDEFTFHFMRPKKEVEAIMREYYSMARENLLKSTLGDAIREHKLKGTATGTIIQPDFDFHREHGQTKSQIYANLMDHASTALLERKKANKRGTITLIEDNRIIH